MLLPAPVRKFLKQREMLRFYRQFIRADELCFDIGANRGQRSDIFLKLGAKVIAVEPQELCYQELQKKYAAQNKISLVKAALGAEKGEAELLLCEEASDCSTLSRDFVSTFGQLSGLHWKRSEKVSLLTLEELCSKYGRPQFCKVDVEGYESEVFKGLKSPLPFISFEFNRPLLEDSRLCLELLAELGNYRCNFIAYEFMNLKLQRSLPLREFQSELHHLIPDTIQTGEILVELI